MGKWQGWWEDWKKAPTKVHFCQMSKWNWAYGNWFFLETENPMFCLILCIHGFSLGILIWSRPLVFFGAASANPEADGRRALAPSNGDRPSYSGSAQLGSALDSLSLANCPLPTSFLVNQSFWYSIIRACLDKSILKGWSVVGKLLE